MEIQGLAKYSIKSFQYSLGNLTTDLHLRDSLGVIGSGQFLRARTPATEWQIGYQLPAALQNTVLVGNMYNVGSVAVASVLRSWQRLAIVPGYIEGCVLHGSTSARDVVLRLVVSLPQAGEIGQAMSKR